MGGLLTNLVAQSPEHQGMGGLPAGPGRVNCQKYPNSWVRAVQPPSLGGSAVISRLKAWVAAVHSSLTGDLPAEIFAKVVPSIFRVLA
ncbi:hypothetical protein BHM03_00031969 [Ensete ventricosum]|nr:hypothetical protein BHM03_00031969 [Ensete ventricosum]